VSGGASASAENGCHIPLHQQYRTKPGCPIFFRTREVVDDAADFICIETHSFSVRVKGKWVEGRIHKMKHTKSALHHWCTGK